MSTSCQNKGLVFDIQRFALQDGPGIRTTVFLKGCGLHCAWCHNPESQNTKPEYMIKYERCITCSLIGQKCPFGVLSIQYSESGSIGYEHATTDQIDPMLCPNKAVRLVGQEYNVTDILQAVLEDVIFYEFSGGGITVSGGEPMDQFDFTYALLKGSKDAGVHTCLDTSGDAPTEKFMEILPQVDLFLYDYKITDPDLHYNLTGSSNKLILQNLDTILNSNASVILRCPIIPGINDNEQHLKSIAALSKTYPTMLGIELLAYHDLGRYKHKELGKTENDKHKPVKPELRIPAEDDYGNWVSILKSFGCDCIINNS